MSAELTDSGSLSSPLQFAPYPSVAVRHTTDLEWTGENPIPLSSEYGCLFPQLQSCE
jgi:hypothetical protein